MKRTYFDWVKDFPAHVVIRKEGCFYTVRNKSAEVLHDILGYSLGIQKTGAIITGSPALEIITKALEQEKMDYIVVVDNEITEQVEFENNTERTKKKKQSETANNRLSDIGRLQHHMDQKLILQIKMLDSLVAGIDPFTGEYCDDEHILNRPEVKEILVTAQKIITQRKKYEDNKPLAAGALWSKEEDQKLIDGFSAGKSVSEIAEMLARSKGAIHSRLNRYFARQHQ